MRIVIVLTLFVLLAAPTCTPAQAPAVTFTVDASTTINPFARQMLGVGHGNWDHAWGKPFPGAVPALATIYKAANVGLIRYAGGLWANFVGWERLPQRTPYGNYYPNRANYHKDFAARVNTSVEYNFHYGQDEIDSLAKLAQESGADVMIQVNISRNDPAMWADMLHYTNIERGYNFRYWELGNELDLECQRGNQGSCISADEYQRRAAAYTAALTAVDPNIIVVGGVPAAGHDIVANNWADTGKISRYLTAGALGGTDALSFHWYTDCNLTALNNVFAWKYDEPDTAWQHMYSRYWSSLGPRRVQKEVIDPTGRPLQMGVTEYNLDACDMDQSPVNSNHVAALWYADTLARMAYNGIDFVTWYQGYGHGGQGFPSVFVESDQPSASTIYVRPIYYAMFLYGNYFGDTLVKISGPAPETISVSAAVRHRDPSKLYLMVTNLSDKAITAQIDLQNFTPLSGSKYVLSNPNPVSLADSSNGKTHGETINGYTLTAANLANAAAQISGQAVTVSGTSLTATYPAYTVTALVLTQNAEPADTVFAPLLLKPRQRAVPPLAAVPQMPW